MAEASSSLSPGVVIAETYEIERQLGQGGMGEVWLAKHRRLAGKLVAIKVLHIDRQLPLEAVARFKREAEIAARLEHPNIVQVLDFNTLPSGQPYLVMEYLKGQSLSQRAHGLQLPLEQVAGIMRQVGAALQAAHRAGVVHRDLKPENIYLVPTALGDQVKVLDFGISKLSDSNTVQTTDSVLIGTPLYMSPEQALGNNSEVTAQSDLFSLGSISYELLTGQAPFFADSVAKVVFRIAYEKHPPLQNARPDLPPQVIAAIEHALEKDRAARTPGIEAFVMELTGQPLAEVSDASSGVYQSGMSVTPSMISGQTRAPSGSQSRPPPPTEDTSAPQGTEVKGWKVVVLIVVLTLGIATVVTRVRMDNWAEREAYRSSMRDAGWVMLEDGNFIRPDAGEDGGQVDASTALSVEVDAGVAEVIIDAGTAAVIDAAPKVRETPPTAAEVQTFKEVEKNFLAKDWETVFRQRNIVRSELKNPTIRRHGYELVLEAACARADNAQLLTVIREYKAMASGAQVAAARKRCIARYPPAADLDW